MAEALVGGAFLSGFVNVVFDRLLSPEVASLIRGKKLDLKLIERMKTTLCAVEAVLNDAERKQINDLAVKKWLDDLRDAVYVADDLLDRLTSQAATVNENEVSNFFSGFLILNSRDRKVVREIEDITSRLEYIVSFKYTFGLKEIPSEDFSWRTSTSLLQGSASDVYGRDRDRDNILKLLLDDNCEESVSVIPIWGMGGVGKTTLAQWLYNDENLMGKFDLSAWVCVSEESSIIHITRSVLVAITSAPCDVKDLNLLQLELKEKLAGKKFFLVLDDVWNIDSHGWNSFRKPFQYGKKGSKVLVTSRSGKVASTVQTTPPYFLHELLDEYCWSLFAKHAHFPQPGDDPNLEKIGKDIVKRCQGLPLAIETLGCLLQTEHDINTWNAVMKSEMWEFPIEDSKIIPALKISYYHLPPHLKRCFAYCSLFPKDYNFSKDKLILLWMAEDLLRPQRNGETPEEVGSKCFDGLTSRSFFKRNDNFTFVMHDLMHDLAISVAGGFYLRAEELGKIDNIQLQTRHLSFGRLNYPIEINFDAIDKLKSLRTFLPIDFRNTSFGIENLVLILLSKFKYLRVLSFRYFTELDIIPDSIGELIHMRYLDLYFTRIKTLPESLCQLCNLQTLNLTNCHYLISLPSGMQHLTNLQHLHIDGTSLKEMPRGMRKLKQLQVLNYFVAGECEENGIKELGALSNIHGSLSLRNLENVTNSGDAEEARMKDKTHIKRLSLEWSSHKDMVSASHFEREILDKLQPHKGLEDLTIERYRGTRFPDWLGYSSYHRMTKLVLESCSNCYVLPSLGQLHYLKSLFIFGFDKVRSIGDEFYKTENDVSSQETPFPSLEELHFRNMSCWEEWHSPQSFAFPQLKELRISDCPSLKGDLPHHLPALKILIIRRCPKLIDLPDELPALKSLEMHGCEQLVCSLPNAPAMQRLSIFNIKGVVWQEFPISLHSMLVQDCQLVESMLGAITHTQLTCLESLTISDCSCAISIPGDCLPESLKDLKIRNCKNIELPNQHKSLESLRIEYSCDLLTTFSLDGFPNLRKLEIRGCVGLQSLSASPLQSKPSSLDDLLINDCPNFLRFPTEGLAAPNLTRFCLFECPMLKSLPSHMRVLIPKLEFLRAYDCPEIDAFPEGGLPSNLKTLRIENCDNLLRRLSSMGVHVGLTSLYIVSASSDSFSSFPMKGLLPQLPSLDTLYLERFETMETLNCNALLHLTSLQFLQISGCPKLNGIVGERLPLSLLNLYISGTPLLEEQCEKKHHQIWHKICHIPGIHVKGRWLSRS